MAISAEQRLELALRLVQHTEWRLLSKEQVQMGIDKAQVYAGREFTAFIQNGFRMQIGDYFRKMEDLAIVIPALPRPTLEELRAKFPWIKEKDGIERDTSPTEAVTLELGTILLFDESQVEGTEYERRIAPFTSRLLGLQHLEWLLEHQDEYPAFEALLGKIYIDGLGLIVLDAHGSRNSSVLVKDGERWHLHWYWFGTAFGRGGRLAVSSK